MARFPTGYGGKRKNRDLLHKSPYDPVYDDLDFGDAAQQVDDALLEDAKRMLAMEEANEGFQQHRMSDAQLRYLREAIEELHRRESESLTLYEPMPEQARFHASLAQERLVIGGNRGGKTLSVCVEVARCATCQDPYKKYSEDGGAIAMIGWDLKHCGKVFYKKMFKAGAFKVIYDPVLGRNRAFRPGAEWDEANSSLAKPAPPLIPARFVRDIDWEDKKSETPRTIRLTTGYEINFFSSIADPPKGWDFTLAAFDEEIDREIWYTEINARLLDQRTQVSKHHFLNGRFIWGATPQTGTVKLYELSERADKELEDGVEWPSIEKFNVSLLSNVHISQEAKDDFIKKIVASEDDYNVRVLGHFAILGSLVYAEFNPRNAHGCDVFSIPDDWTRYAFIDPGRQVCAVLFVAVPPPSLGSVVFEDGRTLDVQGRKFIYDELYIKKCNAVIFGEAMKRKTGIHRLYDMIIDYRAGRVHEIGSGKSIERRYSEALRSHRVGSTRRGYQFTWSAEDGGDQVKAGVENVRAGLHVSENKAGWCIMRDRVPNFLSEAKKYSYKKDPKTNVCTDVPLQKDCHLMDCWRYAGCYTLRYHKPEKLIRKQTYTAELLKAKAARKKAKAVKAGDDTGIRMW